MAKLRITPRIQYGSESAILCHWTRYLYIPRLDLLDFAIIAHCSLATIDIIGTRVIVVIPHNPEESLNTEHHILVHREVQ